MARKSTGKRLRFDVFKRDHFTCQYCGAQPPSVVLVCDHVTPVAEGGSSTLDNLITACEPCNQGKAHKPLSAVGIRPDADLLYLSTQQEIAEIRRYQEALIAKQAAIESLVVTLQETWTSSSGLDWSPGDTILRNLLSRYAPEIVGRAVVDVACKCGTGYISTYNDRKWTAYLFAVCRTMSIEAGDLDTE